MIKHIFFHNGTLHLVLKSKWYDLIKSGIKKEEYREEILLACVFIGVTQTRKATMNLTASR